MHVERKSSGVAKAGLATGITGTAQTLYNPLPINVDCGCNG